MKYEVLYNFISPITGAFITPTKYVILGDERGFGYPSPMLEYFKNNHLLLKKQVDDQVCLSYGAFELGNRYGIRKEIKLGAATFPLPDALTSLISDIPIPNPTFNPASLGDWVMSGPWLPQILAGTIDTDLSNPITKVSSSLAMTQIKTAKNFKLFDNANFIVANNNISFLWDNPEYSIAKLSPQLAAILKLYDLGTSYTFTKAQSLGALETGLLKNTVNDGTGTLSKAVSGEDYVNTADIPIGNLVIIDPLYPLPSRKLIAPITDFKIRKNKEKEFENEKDKVNVLDGIASTFTKLAITSIGAGSLVKIGSNFSELVAATKGIDYLVPDDINTKFDNLVKIIKILFGIKDTIDFFTIANDQVSNLNKVVKTIGGVKDTIDIVKVTASDASKLVKTVSNVVGSAAKETIEDTLTGAATKAVDIFTNKAALLEIEEQIAALAGVTAINTLWNLFNTIGIATTAISGKHYGEYIRGQTLNIKNSWQSTDLNDECANATGEFRPFDITPYKYENRGHGTLWFDSNGRKSKRALLDSDHPPEYYSKPGLRIFSWDSSSFFDNEIAPIHIGLFGYKKFATKPDEYKGFIFETEFDNNPTIAGTGIIFEDDNPNYRFPTKFGLYSTYRTVSSNSRQRYGWDSKETIFEYDNTSFNFNKPVQTKKLVATDNLTIPCKLSSEIPNDSPIGSIFYCSDL